MRFALVLAVAVFSTCLASPIGEEERLDFLGFIRAFEDESPAEVKFYRTIVTLSDEDRSAIETAAHALMSPTASVSERKQLAQKLFEEHPQLLQAPLLLAGRALFESLEPEALAFFGALAKEGPFPTMKDGKTDRKVLVAFLRKSAGKYQELSEPAKESLKRKFPVTLAFIQRLLTNDEISDIMDNSAE